MKCWKEGYLRSEGKLGHPVWRGGTQHTEGNRDRWQILEGGLWAFSVSSGSWVPPCAIFCYYLVFLAMKSCLNKCEIRVVLKFSLLYQPWNTHSDIGALSVLCGTMVILGDILLVSVLNGVNRCEST